jgi:predicted membrane-bound spermidine synthase
LALTPLHACVVCSALRALVIGLGGGALPSFLAAAMGMDVEAVELDPEVAGLARRHFALQVLCQQNTCLGMWLCYYYYYYYCCCCKLAKLLVLAI